MAKQAELQLAKKKGTDFHFISAVNQKCRLAASVIWAYCFRTLCTTRDLHVYTASGREGDGEKSLVKMTEMPIVALRGRSYKILVSVRIFRADSHFLYPYT